MPKTVQKMIISIFTVLVVGVAGLFAQSTAFTYQGKLRDTGSTANGMYDFEFRLFDAQNNGVQVGSTSSKPSVSVVDGVFTVTLDFGAAFTGPDRWIEISISPAGVGNFTTLAPRQKVNSTPQSTLAGTAKNLDCAACVTDDKIDSVSASKVVGTVADASNAENLNNLPPSRYVQTDTNGNVGIGTSPGSGSKLTVAGQLELTSGGIKFPDATTQSTAGLTSVSATGPLTGNGTTGSPLGIQSPLPIKDQDNPARNPFSASVTSDGIVFSNATGSGVTLVIESMSGYIAVSASSGGLNVGVSIGTTTFARTFQIGPSLVYNIPNSNAVAFYNHQLRLYVPQGQRVELFLPAGLSREIQLSGHYVSVP
jgi:hypothetical protein